MKEQLMKWMPLFALAAYAASVFMISAGYYWPGIALIGVGTYLLSAAGIYRKGKDVPDLKKHNE